MFVIEFYRYPLGFSELYLSKQYIVYYYIDRRVHTFYITSDEDNQRFMVSESLGQSVSLTI